MAKYRFEKIAINCTEKKKPEENDRFTYLGLEHLDSGCLKVSRFGAEVAPVGEKLMMRKGDVLFGKRRAYQKKVAIAPFDGIFSAHGMVLRPHEDVIDAQFFPFFISSDYFLDAAIKISVGSLSPTINWRDLKNLEFDLPTQPEQRKLAAVLQSMRDTIECYKTLLTKTDELVKSQFIEMFGDPLTSGDKWKMSILGDEFEIFSGGTPATNNPTYWDNGNIPWIGSNMCHDTVLYTTDGKYITEEGFKNSSAKWAHSGYVLVALVGATIGKTALLTISTTTNQNVAAINVPKNANYTSEYIYILLQFLYSKFMELGDGGFKMANLRFIRQLPLPSPPIQRQKEYSAFFQEINKSKLELEQALSELNRTYKRMLAENLG